MAPLLEIQDLGAIARFYAMGTMSELSVVE